jgi:hypothetical protein
MNLRYDVMGFWFRQLPEHHVWFGDDGREYHYSRIGPEIEVRFKSSNGVSVRVRTDGTDGWDKFPTPDPDCYFKIWLGDDARTAPLGRFINTTAIGDTQLEALVEAAFSAVRKAISDIAKKHQEDIRAQQSLLKRL